MSVFHPQDLLGSGCRVLGHHIPQGGLHLLILALGFGVELGQTDSSTQWWAKLFPEDRQELRTLDAAHMDRDAMEPEHMLQVKRGGLFGLWQLGERHNISHLVKSVHHHQNNCVTI